MNDKVQEEIDKLALPIGLVRRFEENGFGEDLIPLADALAPAATAAATVFVSPMERMFGVQPKKVDVSASLTEILSKIIGVLAPEKAEEATPEQPEEPEADAEDQDTKQDEAPAADAAALGRIFGPIPRSGCNCPVCRMARMATP